MDIEAFGRLVVYGTVQVFIGIASGALVDYVMPDLYEGGLKNHLEAVVMTAEVTAQILFVCVGAAALARLVINTPESVADPSGGTAFHLAISLAMPKLSAKIQMLAAYFKMAVFAPKATPDAARSNVTAPPQTSKDKSQV